MYEIYEHMYICSGIAHAVQELDHNAGTQRLMARSEELEEELSSATAKHEECTVKCEEEHAILKVWCLQAMHCSLHGALLYVRCTRVCMCTVHEHN